MSRLSATLAPFFRWLPDWDGNQWATYVSVTAIGLMVVGAITWAAINGCGT